jgi:hypothetical protein
MLVLQRLYGSATYKRAWSAGRSDPADRASRLQFLTAGSGIPAGRLCEPDAVYRPFPAQLP